MKSLRAIFLKIVLPFSGWKRRLLLGEMAYHLTTPPPGKSAMRPKNRVWGFSRNDRNLPLENRRRCPELRRKSRPTPTIFTPGIPQWPSRDPIGERGGVNLYGFVGNDGVDWVDVVGLIIATQEDKIYRDSVANCLMKLCCPIKVKWKLLSRSDRYDRELIPTGRSDYSQQTFDDSSDWYVLIWDGDPNQGDSKCPKEIFAHLDAATFHGKNRSKELAAGKTHFVYLTRYIYGTNTDGKFERKELLNDSEANAEGDMRRITVSPNASLNLSLDPNKKGAPQEEPTPKSYSLQNVSLSNPNEFCAALWHELKGHVIDNYDKHSTKPWNDASNAGKKPPVKEWGRSDDAIEDENWARTALGLPLRRPQYFPTPK